MCSWIVDWALSAGTMYITLAIIVDTQKVTDVVLALPITVILIVPLFGHVCWGTTVWYPARYLPLESFSSCWRGR